ncbi:ATP-grasp domain-containing protein [Saccharicrinis sp. GN24d3]|uniref:ATP-grasp domain-containing protein n=1 Tax=Saccharicrinis sp. GN24d3 TaxID=3458416 RepID=UPI0040350CFF
MKFEYLNKKLAIIGAGYLQKPLVLKAKELGLEVHCFAWEEGAVCKPLADCFYPISTTDKNAILKECLKINIDGITTIATDIAVPSVNFVAQQMGLIGNGDCNSLVLTNKYRMRQVFDRNQIRLPKFVRINESSPVFKEDSFRYPLIVKPVDRSGSRGVKKVDESSGLELAIKTAQKESFVNDCIVEEYIEGDEVSVEAISWKGKHYVLAITDKETTGSPYFVEVAHHQPSRLPQKIQSNIIQETEKCLTALGVKNGASHSEFRIDPKGDVFVIEVGARMGGDFIGSDLVELSTGYDFLKGVIDVSLGYFTTPKKTYNKCSGVYFLSKERSHLQPEITSGTEKYIVKAQMTNPEIRCLTCSDDRSGYLIYQDSHKVIL